MIKINVNNKDIENYFFMEWDSGIKSLTINTKERWLGYDLIPAYSPDKVEYHFQLYKADSDNIISTIILDDKVAKLIPKSQYLQLNNQCKDQIVFYYIPYKLIRKENKYE